MTPMERKELQERYVYEVINDMDLDSLIQYASDALSRDLDKEPTEDLVELINEMCPDILAA